MNFVIVFSETMFIVAFASLLHLYVIPLLVSMTLDLYPCENGSEGVGESEVSGSLLSDIICLSNWRWRSDGAAFVNRCILHRCLLPAYNRNRRSRKKINLLQEGEIEWFAFSGKPSASLWLLIFRCTNSVHLFFFILFYLYSCVASFFFFFFVALFLQLRVSLSSPTKRSLGRYAGNRRRKVIAKPCLMDSTLSLSSPHSFGKEGEQKKKERSSSSYSGSQYHIISLTSHECLSSWYYEWEKKEKAMREVRRSG